MRRNWRRIGSAAFLAFFILPTAQPAESQPGAPVNAGKPSAQQLRAPVERQSYDFLIFGDRTNGPPEGLDILAQGVEMANRLDPDLVLTVGDMIGGYNQQEAWLSQMRRYKGIMSVLAMPWYPVPGNHDVYARPRQPGGHMALYSEHFGPLYYSFDYKWSHFIVLFSDEALSFRDPARNQNFSAEQMEWLRRDLAGTDAEQIFVFLHHPRWTKRYGGCNWPEVHQMFVSWGKAVYVFAGHIHLYRSDGWIDNVRYYTLATTGGSLGELTDSAALHHIDFVRVRPDGVAVSVLPIGAAVADDFVLGQELDTMYELDRGQWCESVGSAKIGVKQGERSSFVAKLTNTTDRAMRITAEIVASYGWEVRAEPFEREIEAGQSVEIPVELTAPSLGEEPPNVIVRATAHYPLKSGLLQPISVEHRVPVEVEAPDEVGAPNHAVNSAVRFDGAGAVRVDIPERFEQFTLECWVKGAAPLGTAALLSKAESSSYGIFWSHATVEHHLPTAYVFVKDGPLQLQAAESWDWDEWAHVALVFDGESAKWFINGKLHAEQAATSALTHNNRPLYIGAHPDRRGAPSRFFTGMIDEVRLSSTACYDQAFEPERIFERDENTVLLMHFDRQIGGLHPDDSKRAHHGWVTGTARLVETPR